MEKINDNIIICQTKYGKFEQPHSAEKCKRRRLYDFSTSIVAKLQQP